MHDLLEMGNRQIQALKVLNAIGAIAKDPDPRRSRQRTDGKFAFVLARVNTYKRFTGTRSALEKVSSGRARFSREGRTRCKPAASMPK